MKDLSSSSQGEAFGATLEHTSHTILNVMKRREGSATEPTQKPDNSHLSTEHFY
jgi:hypothetical protein